jgi:hypothetical protein
MRALPIDKYDSWTLNLFHIPGEVNAARLPQRTVTPSERRSIGNERCPASSERHLRVDSCARPLHGTTIATRVGTAGVALLRIPE